MSKPILSKIGVFDATKNATIKFASYDTITNITYVIYDNDTGNILTYNDAVSSGSGSLRTFTLAANTISNRLNAYYMCIRVNFSDGAHSEYSDKILFYCHVKPTISIDSVTNGTVIQYPSYSFDLVYNYIAAQGEMLNSYQYTLYDASKNIINQSDTLYYSSILKSFLADGLDNNATYYIRATVETINGYELDTGYILFKTSYTASTNESSLSLTNNYNDGTIGVLGQIYISNGSAITEAKIKRRKSGVSKWTGLYSEKIDFTKLEIFLRWHQGYINSNGSIYNYDYAIYSEPTVLNNIRSVYLGNSDYSYYAAYYDSAESFISLRQISSPTLSNIPTTAAYVRFCIVNKYNLTIQLNEEEDDYLIANDSRGSVFTTDSNAYIIATTKGYAFNDRSIFRVYVINDGYFVVDYIDKYARGRNTEFEYALVPVINNAEQTYIKDSVYSDFDGAIIADKNMAYHIMLEAKVDTVTRNRESSVVTTLSRKYPFVFYGSEGNYYSGSFSGIGIELLSGDNFDIDGGLDYREAFTEWLTNGEAKILKLWDGRSWLICVNGNISIDYGEHVDKASISFEFVEVGDQYDESDLYDNELIDYDAEGVS